MVIFPSASSRSEARRDASKVVAFVRSPSLLPRYLQSICAISHASAPARDLPRGLCTPKDSPPMNHSVTTQPPSVRRTNPPTTVMLARRLNAPPERVFDAWLDPVKIKAWIAGPSPTDDVTRILVEP